MSTGLPQRARVLSSFAVSPLGIGSAGLGTALREGHKAFGDSEQLAALRLGVRSSEVGPIAAEVDAGPAKTHKLMSRSARLAAVALRGALDAGSASIPRQEVGCFLGIGAAGGPITELAAMMRASVIDGALDHQRFASHGLAAANPLLAFHLLNNYVLAHGSILEGLGGPNGSYFSRGLGTMTALREALWSLDDGSCRQAVAGGADCALYPGTAAELVREGWETRGLVPAEGAAALVLAQDGPVTAPIVEATATVAAGAHPAAPPAEGPSKAAVDALWNELAAGLVDLVVCAPWGPPCRERLHDLLRRRTDASILDLSASMGEALAATPALAWTAAVDLVAQGHADRALALSAGIDGGLGGVLIAAGERP